MKKTLTGFLIIMAAGLLWAGVLMSAPGGIPGRPLMHTGGEYADGEVLVKFRDGAGEKGRDRVRGKVGALGASEFKGLGIQRIKVSPGLSVEAALEELRDDPDIEYAEPNYVRHGLWAVDDPLYSNLWGMDMVNAPEAWDIRNSCSPKIGILDSGVSNHIDLAGRVVSEYDFANNQAVAYDDWVLQGGYPVEGHGTHVAGTIAAIANNDAEGVAGLCASGASLMDLKILDSTGTGYISDEIRAVNHARDNGAKVINLSFGGYNCSLSEQAALKSFGESGGLVVAAAGNEGRDNDSTPSFPASYGLRYIISVAASDKNNARATFSNYGYYSTDLAAPGSGLSDTDIHIYSTILNTTNFQEISYEYNYKQGTSMAAPHVTGVVALINSAFPELDNIGIRTQLLGTVTYVPILGTTVATRGVLNASAALTGRVPVGVSNIISISNATSAEITWIYNTTNATEFRVERMGTEESVFSVINTMINNAVEGAYKEFSHIDAPPPLSGAYYRVMAVNTSITGTVLRSGYSEVVGAGANPSALYSPPTCKYPVAFSSGGGGGGCFIATAAYGTSMAPELISLRSFRDNVLKRSTLGRSFVRLYYRNSPPLADEIKRSPAMRAFVRGAIGPVAVALAHPLLAAAAMLLMAAALMISGAIRKGGNA